MMESADVAERAERVAALPMERVGRRPGFFRGTSDSVRELYAQRELITLLSRREIKARYKDSSLGLLWSLMRPLAQLLIYYFAIGKVLGVERQIPSFALFVFIGLTGWTLFTEIISKSTTSIVTNSGLVKKVYLPREVFPLATVGGAVFNFVIQFVVFVVAAAAMRQLPLNGNIGYAVLGVLLLTVYGTAIGLALAAANVYMRDIEHLVEVALIVFFWVSPIVYSFSLVTERIQGTWMEAVYLANPATLGILAMQKGLWAAGTETPGAAVWPAHLSLMLWIALAMGVGFLWLAQRYFNRLQGNFAQEL